MLGPSEGRHDTRKIVNDCIPVWIILINNRLGSFQNKLQFFCHGFNQQIYMCRTSFKDNVPEKKLRSNFYEPVESKLGIGPIFSEKQTCLTQKPVAAFHSSRYQLTFLLLAKTYEIVNCCVWFLATPIWLAENSKNCISVKLVWISKFDSFQNNRPNFGQQGLTRQNSFGFIKHHSKKYIWEKFPTAETLSRQLWVRRASVNIDCLRNVSLNRRL